MMGALLVVLLFVVVMFGLYEWEWRSTTHPEERDDDLKGPFP
jgi:hypothetical protein